ncbi:hypothetical protein [Collimonas fungivorans]|uniref:hypothetical protein n=1 Tax=Collimonas fungivorans TaxID=158899 RepID=UPI000AB6693C|nr:hypothetical protein [Collimonas fungivorans]
MFFDKRNFMAVLLLACSLLAQASPLLETYKQGNWQEDFKLAMEKLKGKTGTHKIGSTASPTVDMAKLKPDDYYNKNLQNMVLFQSDWELRK